MEILISIVILFAIIWILGGIDNNRPVSKWSDEKLNRMYSKLHYASSAQAKAGNYNKSMEHLEKAREVEAEVLRRKQARAAKIEGEGLNSSSDFSELAQVIAERSMKLLESTMRENLCSEEEAKEIISKRIDQLRTMYIDNGFDQEHANERAMQELLGIKN